MRVVLGLILAALCLIVPTAGQSSKALEEKIRVLQETIIKRPTVPLSPEKWKSLVRSQPRNYSMIVMFTALGSDYGCVICKPVHEEFTIVANSYRYAYMNAKQVYFGVVDYDQNPQAFQQLGLNTAPVIIHFPAKGSSKKQDQMDFQRSGFDAEAISKFVLDRAEVHIRVMRPPNYAGPIIVVLLVMLVLGMLYMRRDNMDFIYSTNFWGAVSVIAAVAFMSGQMWNHIRSPPFAATHPQTRQTMFIHSSTQYQLIAETYIVFAMYALISGGVVLLYESGKGIEGANIDKRRYMAYIGGGLIVIFFSLLLSIFRSKYIGYPYYFLFH